MFFLFLNFLWFPGWNFCFDFQKGWSLTHSLYIFFSHLYSCIFKKQNGSGFLNICFPSKDYTVLCSCPAYIVSSKSKLCICTSEINSLSCFIIGYIKACIPKSFFAFSAIPCWWKTLGICAQGHWIRADFFCDVRW